MKCIGPTLPEDELVKLQEVYSFQPDIDEEAELYSLLGNATRLKIIYLLRENESLCVCDLKDILGVTASAVSQHLAKLKAYRFVTSDKQAQTVFYSLTDNPFLRRIRFSSEVS
jgi:ArsR family transcriptional regulator, lead/cadmium/zinc/bismuth-responsive transcriptional repressor